MGSDFEDREGRRLTKIKDGDFGQFYYGNFNNVTFSYLLKKVQSKYPSFFF